MALTRWIIVSMRASSLFGTPLVTKLAYSGLPLKEETRWMPPKLGNSACNPQMLVHATYIPKLTTDGHSIWISYWGALAWILTNTWCFLHIFTTCSKKCEHSSLLAPSQEHSNGECHETLCTPQVLCRLGYCCGVWGGVERLIYEEYQRWKLWFSGDI